MIKYIAYKHYDKFLDYGSLSIDEGIKCYSDGVKLYTYTNHLIGSVDGRRVLNHFTQNEDGCGLKRGKLIISINKLIEDDNSLVSAIKQDMTVCPKYLSEYDHKIWNTDFYNAPIEDLEHIKNILINN